MELRKLGKEERKLGKGSRKGSLECIGRKEMRNEDRKRSYERRKGARNQL